MIVCTLLKIQIYLPSSHPKWNEFAWYREEERKKNQNWKEKNRQNEKCVNQNVAAIMQCSALWDSWELCVFRFLSSHSNHSKISRTWEYSYSLNAPFAETPLLSPNVCPSQHALHIFSVWKIYGIFLIYLGMHVFVFVCVFQYTICTRRENQAERTLNGCYRVVHVTAQCKSNEYSILLKFNASVNVLFSWRRCASIPPLLPCWSTVLYVCVTNVYDKKLLTFKKGAIPAF